MPISRRKLDSGTIMWQHNVDYKLSHFDTVLDRDRQVDGWTDRRLLTPNTMLIHSIT